ncbi:MAG: hypothetical protein HZB26_08805 [Candidatus Hydrogenedentes bacterium]|nr:hypothetical protein [Candidatus Hydrogenedentota bacterium]
MGVSAEMAHRASNRIIAVTLLAAVVGLASHADSFRFIAGDLAGYPGATPLAQSPSGDWSAPFSLGEAALVRIDAKFRVRSSEGSSSGRFVDAILTVDDRPVGRNAYGSLIRVRPSEIGGQGPIDTGWQEDALEVHLLAGAHTLRLGLRTEQGAAAAPGCEFTVDHVEIQTVGTVSFSGDGGFVIHAGGRDFASGSWFSRPGGGWYGLGAGTLAPGEAVSLRMQAERRTENEWEGTLEAERFRLRRSLRVTGHRVEVQDTLTNLSDTDLGWQIRHELAVPETPAAVHLGGDSRPHPSPVYTTVIKDGEREAGIDCWRAANPTVYVPFPEAGVGLVIEDDVTRVHGLTYSRRNLSGALTVGFRDEQFALPPGGQYSTRWAAYIIPGPNKDYYDFINEIRADWGVNDITVPGPTVFSYFLPNMKKAPDEDFAGRLRGAGAWAITTSLNGWIVPLPSGGSLSLGAKHQIGFGPGVLDPHFAPLREEWVADVERVHRLTPGVKALHYFHVFLYAPEPDPESFKDSWVTRPDRSRAITDWGDLNLTPAGQVFPTLTNAVGQGMNQVLDTMLGPMKGDGVYMDEVNYPTGIGWMGVPPCTYGTWDGHSAMLDPATFAVVRKTGYLQLLSADYKKALFKRLASMGAVILGNGEPETGWENVQKFPRHTECRTDPYPRAYESHLYSPIALVEDSSFAHKRHMLEYATIDAFVRLDEASIARDELTRRFYPLTVREVHAGWIQGEERIITMVPRVYSWHESAKVKIYEFGADGVLAATREVASAAGAFDIKVPQEGMVVVERVMDAEKKYP